MATAWITGCGGLIGSHLARLGEQVVPDWRVTSLNRQALELTDFDAVARKFKQDAPALIIHCAAISNSQECEKRPDLSHRINVEVTAFLAELFAGQRMVFFSTDLVFDGGRGDYRETDVTGPLGVYAQTKIDAEAAVLTQRENMVIRTSINGGVSPNGRRGFNEVLVNAWREGRTTRLFNDEFRCPIAAPVTARATWELIQAHATGIYHVAGSDRLSRLQIGRLLASRHPELDPRIEPGSITAHTGPPRAADCSLNCTKAQALLSNPLPGLRTWLDANPNEPF